MPAIEYDAARRLLGNEFAIVEAESVEGKQQSATDANQKYFDSIFQSKTQSYREVLLGCLLARLTDRRIDIHKPYVGQGKSAYSGRTLDERVVNPFLHENHIPCSKGAFLAVFRRNVRFGKTTGKGTKDKTGYDALITLIGLVSRTNDEKSLKEILRYVLSRFIQLRSAADIPLSRLQRMSLEQYGRLIEGLLSTPSGGRFPVLMAEATFTAIKRTYNLGWTIEVQGINVADRAAGAGGDIVIKEDGRMVLAIEVTERAVDRNRIISTFQTKIAPYGIEDYLFLVRSEIDPEILRQSRQYFSQGHEVNFLEIKEWILMVLGTIGKTGRSIFNGLLFERLSAADIPATLKLAWNKSLERITETES